MTSYARLDREKRTYPTKAEITRAVQAARASGLTVAAIDVAADGTIRVSGGPLAAASTGQSLFDQLDAEGRL